MKYSVPESNMCELESIRHTIFHCISADIKNVSIYTSCKSIADNINNNITTKSTPNEKLLLQEVKLLLRTSFTFVALQHIPLNENRHATSLCTQEIELVKQNPNDYRDNSIEFDNTSVNDINVIDDVVLSASVDFDVVEKRSSSTSSAVKYKIKLKDGTSYWRYQHDDDEAVIKLDQRVLNKKINNLENKLHPERIDESENHSDCFMRHDMKQ